MNSLRGFILRKLIQKFHTLVRAEIRIYPGRYTAASYLGMNSKSSFNLFEDWLHVCTPYICISGKPFCQLAQKYNSYVMDKKPPSPVYSLAPRICFRKHGWIPTPEPCFFHRLVKTLYWFTLHSFCHSLFHSQSDICFWCSVFYKNHPSPYFCFLVFGCIRLEF